MKKNMAVAAALIAAAIMCAGFAACNTGSDAESIVSDEVTKEEWEAAFAEENFTNCKLVFTEIYEGKSGDVSAKTTATNTIIQDGEKFYVKKVIVNEGEEYMLPDGTHEAYWADGKRYTVTENGIKVEDDGMVSLYSNVPGSAKAYYEYFEYSKEAKGYVCKQEAPIREYWKKGGIFKFKNGKLAAFLFTETDTYDEGVEITTEHMVFTYGGQTVTLPQV